MNYLSVCSGIEAASVAWEPLGFHAVGFSEIEKFPCQVLAHRYPTVRNFGDMTKYKEWGIDEPVDILAGGTPCQSFSVAGLRKGLEDPRGNLMLTYLGIADRLRPKWVVWENVPGVLSSNGGRDFGTFLGALVELGYGFAYRVLDAQWFGVAQRRRRVFVVGCLGDATSAAKVLFESESVCRNPAPSREKGKGIAGNVAPCLTASNDPSRSPQSSEVTQQVNAILEAQLVGAIGARTCRSIGAQDAESGHMIVDSPQFSTLCRSSGQANAENLNELSSTLSCLHESPIIATYSIKWPAEIDSTMNANFGGKQGLDDQHALGGASYFVPEIANTLGASPSCHSSVNVASGQGDVIAFDAFNQDLTGAVSKTISSRNDQDTASCVVDRKVAVRRLTPIECERLQGFPDGWTDIKTGGKPTPDGPRYKAIGNSMAVPVMRWIGERIHASKAALDSL